MEVNVATTKMQRKKLYLWNDFSLERCDTMCLVAKVKNNRNRKLKHIKHLTTLWHFLFSLLHYSSICLQNIETFSSVLCTKVWATFNICYTLLQALLYCPGSKWKIFSCRRNFRQNFPIRKHLNFNEIYWSIFLQLF